MLYPIAIEKEVHDGKTVYGVIVPDVGGCITVGDTLDEACRNIREALNAHLELMAEDGDPIPTAHDVDYYAHHVDYQDMIWAVVDIDVSAFLGKSEKVNVTLPSRLIARIDEKVAAHKSIYKSRSNYLAQLAMRDLQA